MSMNSLGIMLGMLLVAGSIVSVVVLWAACARAGQPHDMQEE